MAETREPQYEHSLEVARQIGLTRLGLMSNQAWYDDPKRLTFLCSRYKFVAKMFSGMERALEIGCADAFATRIVCQEVAHVTATDFDPIFIDDVRQRMDKRWRFEAKVHDILQGPVDGNFDGAYSMDVVEHIPVEQEDLFMANIVASLHEAGVLILGTPSLESQAHASALSRQGHVNCKTAAGLKEMALRHFENVFIFSMNDEVVHTGYYSMAQYLLAMCCKPRPSKDRH